MCNCHTCVMGSCTLYVHLFWCGISARHLFACVLCIHPCLSQHRWGFDAKLCSISTLPHLHFFSFTLSCGSVFVFITVSSQSLGFYSSNFLHQVSPTNFFPSPNFFLVISITRCIPVSSPLWWIWIQPLLTSTRVSLGPPSRIVCHSLPFHHHSFISISPRVIWVKPILYLLLFLPLPEVSKAPSLS